MKTRKFSVKQVVIIAAAAVVLVGCGVWYFSRFGAMPQVHVLDTFGANEPVSKPHVSEPHVSEPNEVLIGVHVSGHVNQPDFFWLPEGSRVVDAIEAAGGFLESADERSVNLAEILTDQRQIIVNSEPEQLSPAQPGSALININTAGVEELMRLHRVGDSLAREIISHRERNGPFMAPEQIMNVRGIGEATFEGMRDYITVG